MPTTEAALNVNGMDCASCVAHVEKAMRSVGGVQACQVNLARGRATVTFDPAATTPDAIAMAITDAGYPAAPEDPGVAAGNVEEERLHHQIEHARAIVPIVTVQNRYSLTDREHEDVLDYCEREGIGFIPWYPLAAGELTAPGGPVNRIAARLVFTTAQLALAWLLWRSPVMLPIPGTSRVRHLEENIAAASATLDERQLQELAALATQAGDRQNAR